MSWMKQTSQNTEWILSPSSYYSGIGTLWGSGSISYMDIMLGEPYAYGIRPVLNLVSSAPIDINHQGTESDPYQILE